MKKVIISGPTGAIGIALIQLLTEQEIEVTAICHRNSKRICRIPLSPNIKVIECNLDELLTLPLHLAHDYDVFFHLAWSCTVGDSRNNIDVQLKNIQYTIDAVEAATQLGCHRFIGAGSQAEYGLHNNMLKPSTPTFPENGYGIAKLCAGQLSRIRCGQLGIEHIWTRILSVYGPYDGENTLIFSLIRQLLHNESLECTKGEQIWDYMFSKDAANALFLLSQKGISGKVYCLGSGVGRPLYEYILSIRNYIAPHAKIGFGEIPYSPNQVMHLQADISELINDTGFRINYTFQEGIKETVKWIKETYANEDD